MSKYWIQFYDINFDEMAQIEITEEDLKRLSAEPIEAIYTEPVPWRTIRPRNRSEYSPDDKAPRPELLKLKPELFREEQLSWFASHENLAKREREKKEAE